MEVAEPEVFPDLGIWHPLAPSMFEDLKEYLNWTSSRTDLSEEARKGPVIGLVLQRSHIVTGDDAHYVATIQELEFRGARVIPIFCGGLDFSKPVNAFFYDPLNPEQPLVDGIVAGEAAHGISAAHWAGLLPRGVAVYSFYAYDGEADGPLNVQL